MAYSLADPPKSVRSKEIWLQHVAGFIVFQNIRNYAIDRISNNISVEVREQIIKGIDDTVYGLMMVMDSVSGVLENPQFKVRIESKIILEEGDTIVQELCTRDGDGMCMGFHGWKEGDFGEEEVFASAK